MKHPNYVAFASIKQAEIELREKLRPGVRTLEHMTDEEKRAIELIYGKPINPNPKPFDKTIKRSRWSTIRR